ncbi:MAG: hypothetical protein ACI9YH_005054 [Colwellia sp.]|jgi:hypothetical protein
MEIIKLKDFGFNALKSLDDDNIFREESVCQLIDSLQKIEEVKELISFKVLRKDIGLNDVAGIVTNLNGELEKKGSLLVL